MQISPFLLHYPDGSVAIGIKDEQKPDAFLLSCAQGTAYWISLNFSTEVVSIQEAMQKAHETKIDHARCSLLPLSLLRHLFDNYQKINSLLKDLGLTPIPPEGYFWVQPRNRMFFILHFKNDETNHSLCSPLNKKAMVIIGKELLFSSKELKAECSMEPTFKPDNKEQQNVFPKSRFSGKPQPLRQH